MFLLIYAVNKVTQYYKLFERTSVVVFHTSTVNVGAALAAAAVAVVAADVAGGTAATAACACRPRAKGGMFIHLRQRRKLRKRTKKDPHILPKLYAFLATCMLGHTFTDVCTFVVI